MSWSRVGHPPRPPSRYLPPSLSFHLVLFAVLLPRPASAATSCVATRLRRDPPAIRAPLRRRRVNEIPPLADSRISHALRDSVSPFGHRQSD
eukprot:7859069-Pyramimonas_sp.AAC.1